MKKINLVFVKDLFIVYCSMFFMIFFRVGCFKVLLEFFKSYKIDMKEGNYNG